MGFFRGLARVATGVGKAASAGAKAVDSLFEMTGYGDCEHNCTNCRWYDGHHSWCDENDKKIEEPDSTTCDRFRQR